MPTQFNIFIPSTFQLDNTYLSTQIQQHVLDNIQHKDNFPVQINIVDSTKGITIDTACIGRGITAYKHRSSRRRKRGCAYWNLFYSCSKRGQGQVTSWKSKNK